MHFPIIDNISNQLPIGILNKLSGNKILPLVYHLVGNRNELSYATRLYRIPSPAEFEKEIDFILKQYLPLCLNDLHKFIQSGGLPSKKKYFFLSFDDGLRQCEEIIAPILIRKGIPATFFINTGFIDNKDFIHRFRTSLISREILADKKDKLKSAIEKFSGLKFADRHEAAEYVFRLRYHDKNKIMNLEEALRLDVTNQLLQYKPYMSKEQILNLSAKGFSIGAHSVDHPEYFEDNEEEQIMQTINSVEEVSRWFTPELKTFAFPFTDHGIKSSFFKRIAEKGKIDMTFGSAGLKSDIVKNHIHRVPMDDRNIPGEQRLKSELLYYILKKPLGKNRIRKR